MINRRSAGFGFLWGEQRLQPLPLRIGQISSVHTDQYNDLNRVCKHTLALTDVNLHSFLGVIADRDSHAAELSTVEET